MNLCSLQLQPDRQAVLEIHAASCFGSSTPCTGENSTAAQRAIRSWRCDHVPRELVVARDPAITNFTSSCGVSRSRFSQWFFADFAAARTLHVDDPDHLGWHVRDAAMAAGFEHHGVAARRASRCISG